jgi:hypothetical protein
MIDERHGDIVSEHIDQCRQPAQGVVIGEFACESLPGLPGRDRIAPVEGVEHIVAKHDVAAVSDDVELHGGQRQKS